MILSHGVVQCECNLYKIKLHTAMMTLHVRLDFAKLLLYSDFVSNSIGLLTDESIGAAFSVPSDVFNC